MGEIAAKLEARYIRRLNVTATNDSRLHITLDFYMSISMNTASA